MRPRSLRGNSLPYKDDRKQKRKSATPEVKFAARFMQATYEALGEREAEAQAQQQAKQSDEHDGEL